MIILDLEWNSGCGGERLEEILQIGAVRLDELGGPIRDTFCVYIKPIIHRAFGREAGRLPELEQSRRSKLYFPEAAQMFLDWCGEETEFAAWGTGDFKVLRQNAERWDLELPFPERALNLQLAFSHTLKTDRQIALYKAVEYCRVPDSFTFHNALNDAVYTAMVSRFLSPEGLELARGGKTAGEKSGSKGWFGPLDSWEQVLNSRAARRPFCLSCGRVSGVGQWFYRSPERCCAMFRCGTHGRYLCLLETREEEGRWWGKLTTAPMTGEAWQEYRSARAEREFTCTQTAAARRRRSSKHRRKAGKG